MALMQVGYLDVERIAVNKHIKTKPIGLGVYMP